MVYKKTNRALKNHTQDQEIRRLKTVTTQLFVALTELQAQLRDLSFYTGHGEDMGFDPADNKLGIGLKDEEE